MTLRFLLDENLRSSSIWYAIQAHNALGQDVFDVVRVGDSIDLPLGSQDPDILVWAESNNRLLISLDFKSLQVFLAKHLVAGFHCPGILVPRRGVTIPALVS